MNADAWRKENGARTTRSARRFFKAASGALLVLGVSLAALTGLSERAGAFSDWLVGPAKAAQGAGVKLAVGDRLKIIFYEETELPADAAGKSSGGRSFFQRMDLTAEYLVDVTGAVSIPLIGTINVVGQALPAVESQLAAALKKSSGQPGSVSIIVVQRAPVYVMGAVRNPGAYTHTPGMLVLHALSLAGAGSTPRAGLSEAPGTDGGSERLKRFLARKARLAAERQGGSLLGPSDALVRVAGESGANEIVDSERRISELTTKARAQELDKNKALLDSIEREVGLTRERVKTLEQQIATQSARVDKLKRAVAQGNYTQERFMVAQRELDDLRGRRQDLLLVQTQAHQRLGEIRHQMARSEIDRALAIETEIAQVDAEIALLRPDLVTAPTEPVSASDAQTRIQLESKAAKGAGAPQRDAKRAADTTDQAAGPASTPANGAARQGSVVIEIVRRGASGVETRQATETDQLEPGDVVKVWRQAKSG